METFGERLSYALKLRGVTQAALARAVGIKPQAIQSLCSGKSSGSKYGYEISQVLRLDPAWLISGKGEAPRQDDEEEGQAHDPPLGPISREERAIILMLRGLTKTQREEIRKQVQEKERANREVMEELNPLSGRRVG